jgi:hypothetical protein
VNTSPTTKVTFEIAVASMATGSFPTMTDAEVSPGHFLMTALGAKGQVGDTPYLPTLYTL